MQYEVAQSTTTQTEPVRSACQFDGWQIRLTPLHGVCGEVFDKPSRTIIVDPTTVGRTMAIAHAASHIALKHHLVAGDWFTEDQCDAADVRAIDWAKVILDWAQSLEPDGLAEQFGLTEDLA